MRSRFRFLSLLSRLGKDKPAGSPRLLARLLRDEEGSYLVVTAVALPVLLGGAALATEGALTFYNHRTVQSAADSAAYSAAIAYSIDSTANITAQAQAIVASYGFTVGTGNHQANVVATVDTTTYSPQTAIDVVVTRPQLPVISSIWVRNPFNVSGRAKALISGGPGGGSGNCILSLASTGTGIDLQGNPSINAPGCGVFSNSTSSTGNGSIHLQGNASITARSVGAAGTVSVGGSANIGPPPNGYTSGNNPVINPYSGITLPTPASPCTFTDKVANNGETLNPGTYCSSKADKNPALEIKGASVTMNPGTYIFNGGSFNVVSGGSLTGIGVTLVFTDNTPPRYDYKQSKAMDIHANAQMNLQAPAAGATLGIAGMLILGDNAMPTTTEFNFWSNSSTTLGGGTSGVIYVPKGIFGWGGGPIVSGGCTQMIAYKVTLQGNAIFNNSGCDLSGGGGGGGVKPIGNVVTLVK